MKKGDTEERNIEAFSWLPVDRWNVDTIFEHVIIDGCRYCKICDEWVESITTALEKHVERHVKQKRDMTAKAKAAALLAAQEARRIKREEAKLAKLEKGGQS